MAGVSTHRRGDGPRQTHWLIRHRRNAAWDVVDAARNIVGAPPANCVDLGTGTGATARSLRKRYQASVVGVDTSPEMLRAARDLTNTGSLDFCNEVTYNRHNAEATGLAGNQADVVSVFFLLHEAPAAARRQILREGFRLLAPGGTLALCDIHPEYNPSPIMLSGEPYLNGYLDKIDFEAATSPRIRPAAAPGGPSRAARAPGRSRRRPDRAFYPCPVPETAAAIPCKDHHPR